MNEPALLLFLGIVGAVYALSAWFLVKTGLRRLGLRLYVCRGLGMEGGPAPRVRFCCRPEVAVLELVPEGG